MQCQVELFSLVTVKIYQNYTSTTFYSDEQRFKIVYWGTVQGGIQTNELCINCIKKV